MAKSREMQQALDIVAGRKPAAPVRNKWSGLERVGVLLWIGVAVMVVGLGTLYAMS